MEMQTALEHATAEKHEAVELERRLQVSIHYSQIL